jgi:FtsH-binding integral membrane protein
MLAVAQTATVTLCLSAYALQPNPSLDLSSLGALLCTGTVVLFSASLLTLGLGFSLSDVAVSSAAALLTGGFIVLDTKRICEGKQPRLA